MFKRTYALILLTLLALALAACVPTEPTEVKEPIVILECVDILYPCK